MYLPDFILYRKIRPIQYKTLRYGSHCGGMDDVASNPPQAKNLTGEILCYIPFFFISTFWGIMGK